MTSARRVTGGRICPTSIGGALSIGTPDPDAPLEAAVGDTVVYAAHGVGRVVAREHKLVAGIERDSVVLELAAGLRITLSLDDAAGRLRPVADERELEAVGRTLASESNGRDEPWTKRMKESKAKLASGRTTELAELVREGGRFERSGTGSRPSDGELRVYRQARQLLVLEICSARGLEEDEAEAWIEAQTAVPPQEERG